MTENTIVEKEEHWDHVIQSRSGLFDLELREIWNYRDLLWLFVKRDFTAQYKQTILGPLWHIIQPLFTTFMFLFIFGSIAKIPTDGVEPKILFYLSGITIWNYFSSCLTATSNTFVSNAGIFGKVYFPRLVLPLSTVCSNMVKFFIQFALLLGMMAWFAIQGYGIHISLYWLLIPLLVVMMALMGLGLGIIISSLTIKYRDFTVLVGFGVQLLMYAAPVAYPLSYLQGSKYIGFIKWNPLTPIIETFRFALFGKGSFDWLMLGYSGVVIIVLLAIGVVVFSKVEKSFMDTV